MRRGYPSDLTHAQWEQIAPLFAAKETGRPPSTDRREIVNAILYMLRTGCQWRYLPGRLPALLHRSFLLPALAPRRDVGPPP